MKKVDEFIDETKQKHRDAMKGFKHSEETKKRMSKPKTDEVKQKMKQAALKREKLKRELKQNFQKIN
jgi:vacuolar-type H+-ATPase subunit H